MLTFTVHSSHGSLLVNSITGLVNNVDGSDYILDIKKFDIDEWKMFYKEDSPEDIDILSIGYWDNNGKYQPAEYSWRLDQILNPDRIKSVANVVYERLWKDVVDSFPEVTGITYPPGKDPGFWKVEKLEKSIEEWIRYNLKEMTGECLFNKHMQSYRDYVRNKSCSNFDVFLPYDPAIIKLYGQDTSDILVDDKNDPVEFILFTKKDFGGTLPPFYIFKHISGNYSTIAENDSAYGTLEECLILLERYFDVDLGVKKDIKLIEVQKCAECPYNKHDSRNNEYTCHKTHTPSALLNKDVESFPNWCPLENAPDVAERHFDIGKDS
jgi:hypothetical protein